MSKDSKKTTTICPKCGGTALMLLSSLQQKRCYNKKCRAIIPWFLEEDQKPLIIYQR